MALPTVRMSSSCWNFPFLSLSSGQVAVSGGLASVPIQQVKEAMTKNFVPADHGLPWPLPKNAMVPPAPLNVVYLPDATPSPYVAAWSENNGLQPLQVDGLPPVERGWTPRHDSRPYAAVALPDGTTLNAPNPGFGFVTIPDQYVAYFKTQSWVLLSDVMPA